MDRRPISQSVRQWLLDEIGFWQSSGILSADQSGRLLDLYETPSQIANRKHSMAMFALCGLAATMIGLAALLVVGYNWQDMTASLKLFTIFGTIVGTFAVAFWLRQQRKLLLTSEVLFFLTGAFYGAAIWLVAEIFHIQSHYPDGVWFWALGVLPFALALDTILLHTLYAGLLAVWVGTEILGFESFFPDFSYRHCALSLPFLVVPGLVWAYAKRSAMTIGIYAPVLAWWAILVPIAWHWQVDPIYFVGLMGALMLLIAEMHREGSPLAVPYRFYGILIIGGALLPLSFGEFIIHLLRQGSAAENYAAGLVIGLVGAVAALVVVFLQQRGAQAGTRPGMPFVEILRRQWLPIFLIALLAGLCCWSGVLHPDDAQRQTYHHYPTYSDMEKWTPEILVPTALANAAMIALALWLMRRGLREDSSLLFAAGVIYFLLWAILRYIDLFAGVGGMLGAALMFLLCGVGLFAVARFWRNRKEIENG